jgi:biotin carboxylase
MFGSRPMTLLCLASYEKGAEFMRECKRQGCRVLLLTRDTLADADWPRDAIDAISFLPGRSTREKILCAVSALARTQTIDRIVSLDEDDVGTAAMLREHLCVAGMGSTTGSYFHDKLAMRVKAHQRGILVPEFIHVLHDGSLRDFLRRVPPPWVLKPRSGGGSKGITKLFDEQEFWWQVDALGDRRSHYLLEQYVAGDIYHVDSIVSGHGVCFAIAHKYGYPPLAVAQAGGVFSTRNLDRDSADARALEALNRGVLSALGLERGITHTEFIQGGDGRLYFLETAARVAGANIAELIEAASGINLWVEWAKIEVSGEGCGYELPAHRDEYAGILLCLARQERPDTSAYDDAEIVWRLEKPNHAGLIVASRDPRRIEHLLETYTRRFCDDFLTAYPPLERSTPLEG